ncbi:MarR family transcriptional regulator [Rubripirellula sp.]|nr:MarR family transcriptional regulator [Rubripirellula sp.]MDB4624899.1 MarR family transcriptional regulator [Rubripirellula sp.]
MGSGYTFSQCHVMLELSSHNSLNLVKLADFLLIDKSNTSRTVKKLVKLEMVATKNVTSDHRQRLFTLTAKRQQALLAITQLADQQVRKVVEHLSDEQQEMVIQGMQLYTGALRKSRLQSNYQIRRIQRKDNAKVAREYGTS